MAGQNNRRKLIVVTGGSASGKSQLAEEYACRLAEDYGLSKYYLATMAVRDAEAARKVRRHQERRAGKGWQTVECPVDIENAAAGCAPFEATAVFSDSGPLGQQHIGSEKKEKRPGSLVLLECMSNLTANEMFRNGMVFSAESTAEKILSGVRTLRARLCILMIVTNEVFSDGIPYDEGTMEYLEALGRINSALADEADEVYEAVAGIPVRVK